MTLKCLFRFQEEFASAPWSTLLLIHEFMEPLTGEIPPDCAGPNGVEYDLLLSFLMQRL